MAIYAKRDKKKFEPCPEGLAPAVCCDVVDLGMVNTEWGPKHKIQIRWVVDAKPRRADGKPYMVSRKYTLSLHEKANLTKMLEVWRNKQFTEDELENFDIEKLIGAPCQIQVAQGEGDDGKYSFPQVVLKAALGEARVQIPGDYVRECNRPDYQKPPMPEEDQTQGEYVDEISDDDIPF